MQGIWINNSAYLVWHTEKYLFDFREMWQLLAGLSEDKKHNMHWNHTAENVQFFWTFIKDYIHV